MVKKGVDGTLVTAYEKEANQLLEQVRVDLQDLVDRTAAAEYKGPNAQTFKEGCSTEAYNRARDCNSRMTEMAASLSKSASFISTGLGGPPIKVLAKEVRISKPQVEVGRGDYTEADGDSLRDLSRRVDELCTSINSGLNGNLAGFRRLGENSGMLGPEYTKLLSALGDTTNGITKRMTKARDNITKAVGDQIKAIDI